MSLETALPFASPETICSRIHHELRPRTPVPHLAVEFRPFASANSSIRMETGKVVVKVTDLLRDAPLPILESLLYILFAKLYRKPVPALYRNRYRRYLNRDDVRQKLGQMRQERGRKFVAGPEGQTYDLVRLFEELNVKYFHGLMARPTVTWSRTASRVSLGHYDPSHHVIVISRLLDSPQVPPIVVKYVMFHEMLHLRHPEQFAGPRRRVHTAEFKKAEREFEDLPEAKALLRGLL